MNKDSWGLTGVIMSILLEKTRLFFVGDAGVWITTVVFLQFS